MRLSTRRSQILTMAGSERACLVLVNDVVAAIFVRLDAEFYGADRHSWYLEAGFGPCETRTRQPFPSLREAVAWGAEQLGSPTAGFDVLVGTAVPKCEDRSDG